VLRKPSVGPQLVYKFAPELLAAATQETVDFLVASGMACFLAEHSHCPGDVVTALAKWLWDAAAQAASAALLPCDSARLPGTATRAVC
jgi:hypothetical protein